jgi:anti-anti-sigma factor
MNVFCEQIDGCLMVRIEGDIAVPHTEQFREFLLERIETGSNRLLLDFTNVPYIDSSAISTLLSLLQSARNNGGDIRLSGINDRIEELFEQVGLMRLFRHYDSREDGLESYGDCRD